MRPFVRRMIVQITVLSVLLLIAGCEGGLSNRTTAEPVNSQDEAGSFSMAVTLVAPWEDYVDALTADFSLTAEEALHEVIPTTGVLEELDVSQQGVSAKFGLPRITASKSKTKKTEGGDTTTVTEETLKREPGEIPDAGSIPGLPAKTSGAPGSAINRLSETVADPHLVYSAATALYQEVQLLKRYVRDAAQRWDMVPYIVRVQLGSTPYRRNLPYDAYATFSFFPNVLENKTLTVSENKTECENNNKGSWSDWPKTCYGDTAVVLPLIVTDSLEGTFRSRTDESVRQMALSLGFIVHGIAGDIGFNKLRDELRAVVGTEVNSLLTVGSLTEGVTSVRLGAARQGGDAYVMVPRNHQITLLVMFPKNFVTTQSHVNVSAIARIVLRNTLTGLPLPVRERSDEMEVLVGSLLKSVNVNAIMDNDGKNLCISKTERKTASVSTECQKFVGPLIGHFFRNDFIKFRTQLSKAFITLTPQPSNVLTRTSARGVWLNFAEELGRREFTGSNFDLPRYEAEQPPLKGQVAPVVDDGRSMTAILRGGRRLIEDRLSAHLKIDAATLLPATGVSVTNGGSAVTATFPSAIKWKLRTDTAWTPSGLVLCLKDGEYAKGDARCTNDVVGHEETYSVRYITTAPEPTPVFTWRANPALTAAGTQGLVANVGADNMTSIEFIVEAVKKGGVAPLVDTVRITVPGANVKSHTAMDASGGPVSTTKTFKGLDVTPDALVRLDLEILGSESTALELSGVGLKGGKAAGDSPPSLTFILNRPPAKTAE